MDLQFIYEVLAVAKRLDEKNLVNAYEGNISAKHDGLIYITPTTKNKAYLTPEMISVIDEDGNQISGNCKPTSELPMHTDVYKIRDNIGGIVHCHPTFMTAYAICNKKIQTFSYPEMIANFCTFDVAEYGRPGTSRIIEAAVPILKEKDVCLLGNHGIIAVGETVTDAMNKAEAAEAITQTLFLADVLGGQTRLPEEDIQWLLAKKGYKM